MSTTYGAHVRRDTRPQRRVRDAAPQLRGRIDAQGLLLFLLFATLTVALTLLGCLGTSGVPFSGL